MSSKEFAKRFSVSEVSLEKRKLKFEISFNLGIVRKETEVLFRQVVL